jgi:uncharacterized protein DUF6346
VSDDDWLAERKQRMADLTAQAEADVAESRRHRERLGDAGPVVVRSRRRHWYTDVLAVAVLVFVSWLLISSALTLARFTGNSLDDARRRGTATVEQCRRRGPITLLHGFGSYRECTVSVVWNTSYPSRIVISKPGFFASDKPGDTFEIGENTGSRGRIGYSRAALPDRPWITVVAGIIDVIGALLLLIVVVYVWRSVKEMVRRRP